MKLSAIALALTCSLAGATARADPSSGEMVDKGIQLRREHRDAEALAQFKRAEQLNPAPRIKAQIGLAEQALGQWVEAERDLNLALSANEDPWIADHEAALKKALAAIQQHLGSLKIETNVNGAELWVNGALLAALPMTAARVVAGTVTIEVRSQGYESAHRSIDVSPGQTAADRVDLTPIPEASPSSVAPPPATAPAKDVSPATTQRTFAWGALSAAGVALGGAVAAQLVYYENAKVWNDATRCAATTTLSREARCGAYLGRAETAQTFATLGFVASGALGAASAVLFLTSPPHRSKASTITLDALPGGAAVGIRGQF